MTMIRTPAKRMKKTLPSISILVDNFMPQDIGTIIFVEYFMPQAIGTIIFVEYFMPQDIGTIIFVDCFMPKAIETQKGPGSPKLVLEHFGV